MLVPNWLTLGQKTGYVCKKMQSCTDPRVSGPVGETHGFVAIRIWLVRGNGFVRAMPEAVGRRHCPNGALSLTGRTPYAHPALTDTRQHKTYIHLFPHHKSGWGFKKLRHKVFNVDQRCNVSAFLKPSSGS